MLGHQFKVRTDEKSLKYLLEQRIGTSSQQKWVTKLLDFNFIVEYKPDALNRVTDALSQRGRADK